MSILETPSLAHLELMLVGIAVTGSGLSLARSYEVKIFRLDEGLGGWQPPKREFKGVKPPK